jgi:hypothetical protein
LNDGWQFIIVTVKVFDWTELVLVEYDDFTIIYSFKVKTLFYVIKTWPEEEMETGVLEAEYCWPVESKSL